MTAWNPRERYQNAISVMKDLNGTSYVNSNALLRKPISIKSDSSVDRPLYNIDQAGTISIGNTIVHGNQIGIQNNYGNDSEVQISLTKILNILEKSQVSIQNNPENQTGNEANLNDGC